MDQSPSGIALIRANAGVDHVIRQLILDGTLKQNTR